MGRNGSMTGSSREIRVLGCSIGAVLSATSPSPSSDAMSVMRDEMTLGAWCDSGTALGGIGKELLAGESWRAEFVGEVIVSLNVVPVQSGLDTEMSRHLEA